MTTTFVGHFLGPNVHSSRPAAAGLPEGTMYVCTTHNKIERVVAAAWVDYATLGTGITVSSDGIWDSKGDLAAASGPDAASKLVVGTNGQVLTADSAQTLGVKWAAAPGAGGAATDTIWDAKGDLVAASGADAAAKLPVGSNGQVLTADSAQTLGIKWAPAAGGMVADTLWDTKGDLAVATGADAAAKLPVGTDSYLLIADSSQTVGLRWGIAPPFILNTQTSSYTLVLGDAGKLVGMNIAGANTLTVPLNSSVAFPVGTQVTVRQMGAGQTTVAATGGVTLNARGAALKLAGQYAYGTLVKVATDTWELTGDITT